MCSDWNLIHIDCPWPISRDWNNNKLEEGLSILSRPIMLAMQLWLECPSGWFDQIRYTRLRFFLRDQVVILIGQLAKSKFIRNRFKAKIQENGMIMVGLAFFIDQQLNGKKRTPALDLRGPEKERREQTS